MDIKSIENYVVATLLPLVKKYGPFIAVGITLYCIIRKAWFWVVIPGLICIAISGYVMLPISPVTLLFSWWAVFSLLKYAFSLVIK